MRKKTSQLDETIKIIDFILLCNGLNLQQSNFSPATKFKYRLIYIFNLFWLLSDLAGAIYWFIDGIVTGKDFLDVTFIAPCIILSILATVKGLFLVTNEGNIRILLDNLKALDDEEKNGHQYIEKDVIVNKELNFLHSVIRIGTMSNIVAVTLFAFSPLILMLLSYYNNGDVEFILPFLVKYPFNPFKALVWPFVYLHQIWSASLVSLGICSGDFLFFICCTYIKIQFKLLRHSVVNIIPLQRNRSRFPDDDDFKAKFRDIIKWHQDLFELVGILETIYSKSILINFVSSSLTICLTSFNVAMLKDNTPFILTFMSFLFLCLFQIFFLCFFADMLITSSVEIQDAVYESLWYMAEPRVGKKLLLMQIRAQKPCKLSANGFADLNLNLFMRVLSTAWSYFALLQTLYGGSK